MDYLVKHFNPNIVTGAVFVSTVIISYTRKYIHIDAMNPVFMVFLEESIKDGHEHSIYGLQKDSVTSGRFPRASSQPPRFAVGSSTNAYSAGVAAFHSIL